MSSTAVRNMRPRFVVAHVVTTFVIVIALMMAAGCGSSATTSTAPSPLVRCSLTLSTDNQPIPATGGGGSIGVSATRECTWTVNVDGPWLSLRSGQTGQGDGTVEFAASANPDPVQRRGALVLNGQRAEITQAAAVCDISLAQSAASFTPEGGSGRVEVRASSSLCTWNATSDSSWIQIRSASEGRGSGVVLFDVASTTGPPRTGTLTVGGQRFSVTQSEGCTFSISPSNYSAPSAGGSSSVAIATTAACPWAAASNIAWITVSPSTGSGPGRVTFSVDSNDGPPRDGSAVIAGNLFTVAQATGCTYDVQPTSSMVPASGGTATVTVSAPAGCVWSASSGVPWISIQGRTSGTGTGTVTLAAASTTGPARNGTVTVAGHQVTVTQGQGCAFEVSKTQDSVPASGGTGKIDVTTSDGCPWSSSSDVSWITIQSGTTGTGGGSVTYSAAPTTGPTRNGTLTIAGHKVTITQGQGCTFTINPTQETISQSGGSSRVAVTTADGCPWTATVNSNAPWISITSGATGSGPGSVQYSVAPNSGPSRNGTMTIAGLTFTVTQGIGCSYSLSPTSENVPAAGGSGTVAVSTSAGCPWSATSSASWLTIGNPTSGTGNGTVSFTAAANTGAMRQATLTIAMQTFTVNQASGCTYTVSPETIAAPASAGTEKVEVSTASDCPWSSSTTGTPSWISIAGSGTGTGNGRVDLSIAANTGPSRNGTVTVAGRTVTVNQASGCTYSINPTSTSSPAGGGTESVSVTAAAGCSWTAVSNDPQWITVSSGSPGTGNGQVQLAVQANTTGSTRTGTVTIAGRTFTVNQQK